MKPYDKLLLSDREKLASCYKQVNGEIETNAKLFINKITIAKLKPMFVNRSPSTLRGVYKILKANNVLDVILPEPELTEKEKNEIAKDIKLFGHGLVSEHCQYMENVYERS